MGGEGFALAGKVVVLGERGMQARDHRCIIAQAFWFGNKGMSEGWRSKARRRALPGQWRQARGVEESLAAGRPCAPAG